MGEVPEDWRKVCHSYLQKGQEGEPAELQACPPWESDGLVNIGNLFQAHEAQERQQEWSVWIQQGGRKFDQ